HRRELEGPRIPSPDGRPLARDSGHRARQADPRALAVVPRGRGRRCHLGIGSPWHAQRSRQREESAPRRRTSRPKHSGLRRHGGAEVRRAVRGEGARNRGRSAAADQRGRMTSQLSALEPAALLEHAERETGLSDYGDETLPARLSHAVGEIRKSLVRPEGAREAAAVIHWLLTSRLQFFEDRKRYPIAAEKIVRPVLATGEPRSGTTLLHALLSVDPNGRSLRFWEVMYPSPPPGLATAEDPRRARADADWRDIDRTIPRWLAGHPYNDMLGEGLPEGEPTWGFYFRVLTPSAWWRVPMKMITTLPADARAQYRLHKMMLQQCQYARPEKYWVLKGFHGRRLATLFDTYPDACMVWVHRDPVQLIAYQITLFGQINESLAGSLDWTAFVAATLGVGRANFSANPNDPFT